MKPNSVLALESDGLSFLPIAPGLRDPIFTPKDISNKLESGDFGALAFQARFVDIEDASCQLHRFRMV